MVDFAETNPLQRQREVWLRATAARRAVIAEREAAMQRFDKELAAAEAREEQERRTLDELIENERQKLEAYADPPDDEPTPAQDAAIERGSVFAEPAPEIPEIGPPPARPAYAGR